MAHIHTGKDQHDFTVTAFIVRIDGDEPKVLLHMHRKHHVLLPVGGHVELLESPWEAIAHELEEEAGYKLSALEILQPKSRIKSMPKTMFHPVPVSMNTHYIADDHFHSDIEYAFTTKSDPTESIAEGESMDIRWITKAELNALEPSAIFDSTKEVYNFILDEALNNWDSVPTDSFPIKYPQEYRY